MAEASSSTPILFVSDLHFGANYRKAVPDRERHFRDFLEVEAAQASHLFILGDLFEFWMEYHSFIPKQHFQTLAALRRLVDKGVEVHFLSGNHDFNPGKFFQEQMGMHVHLHPVSIRLQGKNMLLLHGDGLAPSDWKYRLMKKVMVHPLSNALFKCLHPDLGMALARWSSKLSRDQHDNRPRHLDQYAAVCRGFFAQGHDIVMHGHTHAGFVKEIPEGVYVNSGEWLGRMEYVSMREGVCRLETFRPQAPV